MKKYIVTITETLVKEVPIEAASIEEAEQTVMDLYQESEIILDADDYYETKAYVYEDLS